MYIASQPLRVVGRALRQSGPVLQLAVLLCLMVSILLCGCATRQPEADFIAPEPLFQCDVQTTDLPAGLRINRPMLDADATGLLRLELAVDNTNPLSATIRHRVEWFDMRGFTVPTVMSRWERQPILPHQTLRIRAIAPSERAHRALVTILRSE